MKFRIVRYTLAFALPAALVAACSSEAPPAGGTGGQSPGGSASTGGAGTGNTAGGMTGQAGGGTGPSTAGSSGSGTSGGSAGGSGGSAAGSGGQSGGAGGSAAGSGGSAAGSGGSAAGSGGSGGSGGGTTNAMGPCDIYKAANNTCVAAYSTTRRLLSTYTGPLYQVRKGGPSPNTGSGGMTMDIGILPNGFANAAAHIAFCGAETLDTCTFSKLYDQSGKENHLTVAKRGCYGCSNPQEQCSSCTDTACENDNETVADKKITVGGNTVFTLHMKVKEGYRNNGTAWPMSGMAGKDMPVGNPADGQGVYMVAEGKKRRPDAGTACCWNFGNVSNNNCYGPSGQMNALMLGNGFWGKGAGMGPWFMGDFEAGVWAGGTAGNINDGGFDQNMALPSMTMDFAFGILKTKPTNYAIRFADATTGMLGTAYDGAIPTAFPQGRWTMAGGIALGIGGDNSNHGSGTFLEGAITNSRPSDATDALVHENVKALGYGK